VINWRDHIHSDPGILGGKPVIRGTRISVELILEYLAEGADEDYILDAYSHITREQVRAAVQFAHDLLIDQASAAKARAA
jgi:uncharacterized protein (DUF433 family)